MVIQPTGRALLILVLALYAAGLQAAISVSPDRPQVMLNESFQLVFEADGPVDGDPDFTPLEDKFQIISTGQSSNFSMLNGQISRTQQWTLTLLPKEAGTIEVPPISFGSDTSPSIRLEVSAGDYDDPAAGRQSDDIFLEASATPMDPYVQSQVFYTLKLYRSVAIAKASLGDPQITRGDAILERLDEDKSYETTIDGKLYQVIERNFTVYPQSSGEITIAPVSFMGQISRGRYGLDPFGPPPRTVIRRSEEVTLNVRGIPAGFSGRHWLPAEDLTLAEEWSDDPMRLQVGDPVTRTLILQAEGLTASQLPELPAWNIPELKYYPDRPVMRDDKTDAGIASSRREKSAIIPNQPGSYTLPAVSIPWWNTRADRMELAELPERTIQVQAAPAAAGGAPPPPQPDLAQPPETGAAAADVPLPSDPLVDVETANTWKWISFALMIAWLTTLLGWWFNTRTPRHEALAADGYRDHEKIRQVAARVIAACNGNEALEAKQHLLHWARLVWPEDPPLGLRAIAARTGSELARELQGLNNALYGNNTGIWQGRTLGEAFAQEAPRLADRPAGRIAPQGRLEPLYRI